ncbi:MAG: hypothetical protein R8G66_21220 [Cytophagales bacterium]|nr:hypothetical protein [Cytophagales bacterium]
MAIESSTVSQNGSLIQENESTDRIINVRLGPDGSMDVENITGFVNDPVYLNVTENSNMIRFMAIIVWNSISDPNDPGTGSQPGIRINKSPLRADTEARGIPLIVPGSTENPILLGEMKFSTTVEYTIIITNGTDYWYKDPQMTITTGTVDDLTK